MRSQMKKHEKLFAGHYILITIVLGLAVLAGAYFVVQQNLTGDPKGPADDPNCKIWYGNRGPCADKFQRAYPGAPEEVVYRSTASCQGPPADADESYSKPYCAEYFGSDGSTNISTNSPTSWFANWKTYRSATYNFEFKYPSHWKNSRHFWNNDEIIFEWHNNVKPCCHGLKVYFIPNDIESVRKQYVNYSYTSFLVDGHQAYRSDAGSGIVFDTASKNVLIALSEGTLKLVAEGDAVKYLNLVAASVKLDN